MKRQLNNSNVDMNTNSREEKRRKEKKNYREEGMISKWQMVITREEDERKARGR